MIKFLKQFQIIKLLKHDEKRRIKLEKIENERKAKIALEKQKLDEEILKVRLKEQALKDEVKIRKTKNKRYQIIFKKRTSYLKN